MTICDREWTPDEDAILNALSGRVNDEINGLMMGGLSLTDPALLPPITMDTLLDAYANVLDTCRGIHVTKIVPPEQGWPMAFYCPICKETTFALSPWAVKPKEGDYFKIHGMCSSPTFGFRHNIEMMYFNRPMITIPPSRGIYGMWWGDQAI